MAAENWGKWGLPPACTWKVLVCAAHGDGCRGAFGADCRVDAERLGRDPLGALGTGLATAGRFTWDFEGSIRQSDRLRPGWYQ